MASLGGYGRGRRVQSATNGNNDSLPAPGGDGGPMHPSGGSSSSLRSLEGAGFGRGLPKPASTFNNSNGQQYRSSDAAQSGGFNGQLNGAGITSSGPDRYDQNGTTKNNGAAGDFKPIQRSEFDQYAGQLEILSNRQNRIAKPEPTRPAATASGGGFSSNGGFGGMPSNDAGNRGGGFREGRGNGFGGSDRNQSNSAGNDYENGSSNGQIRGSRGGSLVFDRSNRAGGGGFGGGFNNDNNRSNEGGFNSHNNETKRGGFGQSDGSGFKQNGGFGGRNGESNDGFGRSSDNGGSRGFGDGGQRSRGGFGTRGDSGASSGRGGFGDGGGFGQRSDDDRGGNGTRSFTHSSKHYNGGFRAGDGENQQRDGGFGSRGGGSRFGGDGDSAHARGPEDERPKASTYVPTKLTEEELFSDERAIAAGEHFDKMFASMDIGHKVTGLDKRILEINSFEEANLNAQILRNVQRANYAKPTPIQRVAIPIIAEGYDVMGCAQTGSGKTCAFMLPIINWIANNSDRRRTNSDSPYAIVIGPTRELVKQLFEEGRKFAHTTGVSIAVAYGQTSVRECLNDLHRGCDIVVATPGRLSQFISQGDIKVGNVRFLVLDEADRMLDQGFRTEIDKFDENPDFPSKNDRTTLMFSATFKEDVQSLARKLLKEKYAFITIGTVGAANRLVEQKIIEVKPYDKKDALIEILKADYENSLNAEGQKYHRKTLVFVAKQRDADVVAGYLSNVLIKSTSMHGAREQNEREQAIYDLTHGDCPVLVATDVCARGLDIKGIEHVINYDLPKDKDTYVHRIGRTARVGHTGKATSFYDTTCDQGIAYDIVEVLKEAQQEVPKFLEDAVCGSFNGAGGGAGGMGGFSESAFGGERANDGWS